MTKIIIADDDPTTRKILVRMLKDEYQAEAFADGEAALDAFMTGGADIIITDLKMPKLDGLELLTRAKEIDPEVLVFMITGFASVDSAILAMKKGAYDYLPKPFDPDTVILRLQRALHERGLEKKCEGYRQEREREQNKYRIITGDPLMLDTMKLARKASRSDSTLLIQGETGVGKELLVRQIHHWSQRRTQPFVAVNCSGLAEGVMESEIFGHEKGAFTGADKRHIGFFEMASQGTIFLDEIGTANHRFQVKLLRFLQERIIYRVGSPKPIPIGARIIAATNQDLAQDAQDAQDGLFRSDLYYRLSVLTISIPPLRKRPQDIPLLIDHFVKKHQHINPMVRRVSKESHAILLRYNYPGNVRELENIIERAMILEDSGTLGPGSLLINQSFALDDPLTEPPSLDIKSAEKEHILNVLRICDYKKGLAATTLGINKTTLWRKMKGYQIEEKKP